MENMSELAKKDPPPLEDDRSTKKAKFRAEAGDEDNPPSVSFKDKLMESHVSFEDDLMGKEEELVFGWEDVVIETGGHMPSIAFSQRVQDQLVKPWKATVVIKLLGRSVGYKVLCNRLESLWNRSQGFSVIDLENDFFLVKFKTEEDAYYALTQGPWTILGHYLAVQQWSPSFDCSRETIDSIIAWIRLPGMPLHYYHKKILTMLGHVIGNVVRIDYNTESASRGKFARIAVELDLAKSLCSQFLLDGKVQKVEYENLPTICFECGKYGHLSSSCSENKSNENLSGVDKVQAENNLGTRAAPPQSTHSSGNPKFGPWMVVSRKDNLKAIRRGKQLEFWFRISMEGLKEVRVSHYWLVEPRWKVV